MSFDLRICLLCVGEGKLVMSWWSWELEGALSWERKAQILLLEDFAVQWACVRRSCLGRVLSAFVPAVVAWALSEDFFIPLKAMHAASFAALFALKLIFFFFFSESRDQWGLSAK